MTDQAQSSSKTAVAVLGTGTMGTPIARNLLAAGFPVSVWNRTAAHAAPLADDGARLASSPADAAKDADIVLTMVANGAAVSEAMSGSEEALEAMRPGSIWIQMATVGVDWIDRLGDLAKTRDIDLIDAPVSGQLRAGSRRHADRAGLRAGGSTQPGPAGLRCDRRPSLWLGPAGYGTRMKIVLNNWLVTQVESAAETLCGRGVGPDPHLFPEAIDGAPLGSPYAVAKAKAMIAGNYEPGFPLRHAFKDAGLSLDAARERDLDLPLTSALVARWRQAIADGHQDEDVSSVFTESEPSSVPISASPGTSRSSEAD